MNFGTASRHWRGALTAALATLVMGVTHPALAAADDNALTPAETTLFKRAVASLDDYRGGSGLLDSAHNDLTRLLKAKPNFAPAHREMARYHMMAGYISGMSYEPEALKAAETEINRALELKPDFAEAYVLRGHLYRNMERPKEAYEALAIAEKMGTDDPWLHNNLADLLLDDRRKDEAAKRYQKVLDSGTDNRKAIGAAIAGLTRYYVLTGDFKAADGMHRRAIENSPTSAWAVGNYATFLLCRMDDYDASIKRSREALQMMDYGMARYWLAAALYRKWSALVLDGKYDEAKTALVEAQATGSGPEEFIRPPGTCEPTRLVKFAQERLERIANPGLLRQ